MQFLRAFCRELAGEEGAHLAQLDAQGVSQLLDVVSVAHQAYAHGIQIWRQNRFNGVQGSPQKRQFKIANALAGTGLINKPAAGLPPNHARWAMQHQGTVNIPHALIGGG